MLASKPRGTLYIGVMNDIIRRVEQHRAGLGSAFTRKCKIHCLVWYEEFADIQEAIQREKTMKEWPRIWKINLLERANPHWIDLYPYCQACRFPLTAEYADEWVPGIKPGMTLRVGRRPARSRALEAPLS